MNKPDHKIIYLTAELEGWEKPHWCEEKIADDDIEYIRKDVSDKRIAGLDGVIQDAINIIVAPNPTAEQQMHVVMRLRKALQEVE